MSEIRRLLLTKVCLPRQKAFYANEPAQWAKRRAFKGADELAKDPVRFSVSKKVVSEDMYIESPLQAASKWECPDQNQIQSFGAQASDKINPINAQVYSLETRGQG
jgi:hypothetical protein